MCALLFTFLRSTLMCRLH